MIVKKIYTMLGENIQQQNFIRRTIIYCLEPEKYFMVFQITDNISSLLDVRKKYCFFFLIIFELNKNDYF